MDQILLKKNKEKLELFKRMGVKKVMLVFPEHTKLHYFDRIKQYPETIDIEKAEKIVEKVTEDELTFCPLT
ncbi:MAG: hypothetical protein ABIA62_04010 [Candidatus Woesearchaeota archaeon]